MNIILIIYIMKLIAMTMKIINFQKNKCPFEIISHLKVKYNILLL